MADAHLETAAKLLGGRPGDRDIEEMIAAVRHELAVAISAAIPWPSYDDSVKSCASRRLRWGLWHADDKSWCELLRRRYARVREARATQISATSAAGGCDSPPWALPRAGGIPRVIHHIWLGSALPKQFAALRDTWRRHHPTWRHVLWGDAEAASFGMRNRAAFDRATNFGEKSDLLRYEVLNRYGGVYVDTDFECTRPLDELADSCGFFTGVSNTGTFELNNGLIGAAAAHPLLEELVRNAASGGASIAGATDGGSLQRNKPFRDALRLVVGSGWVDDPSEGAGEPGREGHSAAAVGQERVQGGGRGGGGGRREPGDVLRSMAMEEASNGCFGGTIERTGPGMFTRTIMSALCDAEPEADGSSSVTSGDSRPLPAAMRSVLVLPCSFFYPMPNDASPRAPTTGKASSGHGSECEAQSACCLYVKPETFAVHHYARSWQVEQ